MRKHIIKIIAFVAVLITLAGLAQAQWGQSLFLSIRSGRPVPISIAPTSATVQDAVGINTTVAAIVVTMSDGSAFAGSLSLPADVVSDSILPTAPAGKTWSLINSDEFNASSVGTGLFALVNGCEFGCGVYSIPSAASESGGFLNLNGASQSGCPGTNCGVVLKVLLPGSGYYEARLRSGVGFYNVFWTNQTSNTDCGGGYDIGFESDIMETQGGGGAGQVNTHWNGYVSCHNSSGPGYIYGDAADGYHVYGVWIDATNGITYYRDGVQTDHLNGPLTTAASTQRTVYLHTELSPGSQLFSIDWFRFYQLL